MKDLQPLPAGDAVVDYVRGLWRTDAFRGSAYVEGWVERLARHPIVFAAMTAPELETPHFGTFFGLVYHRTYDEPAVSDLYYLHEVVHAALLDYQPGAAFTSWYRKMCSVEFSASLETEGYVYLHLPELREATFADEIWADRFLGSHRRLGDAVFSLMRQERYKAMQHPDPMDWCEQQVAGYVRQNFQWAGVWKLPAELAGVRAPAFAHVEKQMAGLRGGALDVHAHVRWLEQWGAVPFPDQAELFAPIYWGNKLSYRLRKR